MNRQALNRRPRRLHSSRKQPWRRICEGLIGGASAVAVPAVAFAGLYYWTGAHDANWNTTSGLAGTNWSSSPDFNNRTAGLPGSGDDVFFILAGAQNLTNQLGQDFSIHSLNFTSDAVAANPVTIGGANTLTIGAGGLTSNSNAVITLSTKVKVGAAESWANNSPVNFLTVSGIVSGSSALTLEGTGSTSTPSGAFTFTNTNTYSGALTLLNNSAALTLSGNGSLNQVSSVTLLGGTSLTLDNTSAAIARLGGAIPATSSGGTINFIGNSSTAMSEGIGTLTLGAGASVINASGPGATFTVNGLNRPVIGSTIAFNLTGGATIAETGINNTASTILAGYAVFGVASGGTYVPNDTSSINWATVSGGKIGALTTYGNTLGPGIDCQIINDTQNVTSATQHVNSLYIVGNGAGGNSGVTFTTSVNIPTGDTLVVDSGGVISSGGTGTLQYNGQVFQTLNANCIGVANSNNTTVNGTATGFITSGTGDLDVFTANGSSLRIGSIITNDGTTPIGLTKSGNGVLDLSEANTQGTLTANTYTGVTTINGGTVIINADSNLGQAPSSFVANQLTLNGGALETTKALSFNANRGVTVGPQGGFMFYTGTNHWTINSAITGSGGMAFGALSTTANDAFLNPSSAFTYAGPTTIETANTSYVYLGLNNVFPSSTALTVTHGVSPGNGNSTAYNFVLNGKTLTVGSLAGEGAVTNDSAAGTAASLIVGANNQSTTYTGILGGTAGQGLSDGGGGTSNLGTTSPNLSFTKTGSGTLTLTNANTYTGATAINGGTLLISGSLAAGSAVSVTSGGALGGTGTVNGPVTLTSTGILAPAMSGTTFNNLTLGNNLSLTGGGLLDFNFGAAPATITAGALGASDKVIVLGNLSLGGAITLNITPVAGSFGIGAYDLLDGSANPGGFSLAGGTAFHINGSTNFNYAIVTSGNALDPSVGGGNVPTGDVYLEVLQGNPTYSWVGKINGNWDTATPNWTSASAGNIYGNGSNVIFDNTATGTTAITVTGAGVTPSSIAFNNGSLAYSFTGGAITVSPNGGGITKTQAADVLFNNTVTTSSVNINGGSISVGSTGVLNSTTSMTIVSGALNANGVVNTPLLTVNSNGTLNVQSNGSLNSSVALAVNGSATFNNASQSVAELTGTGSVTLNGANLTLNGPSFTGSFDGVLGGSGNLNVAAGVLSLSNGNNNYGSTAVTGGTLLVTNPTGSATGMGSVHVFSGGVLDGTGSVTGAVTIDSGATLQGTGTVGSTGGVTLSGNLSPAGGGIVGTINLGTTTLGSGANLAFDFGPLGAGNSDFAHINGQLTLSGSDKVTIDPLAGFTLGQYTLAAASSIHGAASFTPSVNTSGAGYNSLFLYNVSVIGNSLVLTVGAPTITWTGSASGNWNFTDLNWSSGSYADANQAVFTDSGVNANVTLDANIAPQGGVVFNNNTINYSFSDDSNAPNGIGGPQGVILNGKGAGAFLGVNTYAGATVINSGTLSIAGDSSIGTAPAIATTNSVVIADGGILATVVNTPSFALNPNRGIAIGNTGGAGATINVASAGTVLTYNGIVADIAGQHGVLNVTGAGELDLGGANTFSGGLNVAAPVKLLNVTAAGTGPVAVNAGGLLDLGAAIANPLTLNNGSVLGLTGASPVSLTITGDMTFNGVSTLDNFDAIAGPVAGGYANLVETGVIHGAGTLNIVNTGDTPDDANAGFRLHGAVSTDFTGTIVVGNAGKFEIQTEPGQATGSQAGTGTISLVAGADNGNTTGTYPIFNVRNLGGTSVNLGNNVVVTGSGVAYENFLGAPPAGTVVTMGTLTVGDNTFGVTGSAGQNPQVTVFSSVKITGSNAGFAPAPAGSTTYPVSETLMVGAITDTGSTNPNGSGITMNGVGTFILTAANSYRGSTTLNGGTTYLAAPGALPATTALAVNGSAMGSPTTLDLNAGAGASSSNSVTVTSLSGAGANAAITNSDLSATRTLTINQSSSAGPTTFAGAITGNLNLIKAGNGSLQLTGTNIFSGTTSVTGGALSIGSDTVNGSILGPVTVTSGATLTGSGSVGSLTIQGGGRLAPGNTGDLFKGAGIVTISNNLDLSAPTTTLSLSLGGTLNDPTGALSGTPTVQYGQLIVTSGEVSLGGSLQLAFTNGGVYTPQIGDTYYIIENETGFPVTGEFSNGQVFLGQVDFSTGVVDMGHGETFAISYTANAMTGGQAGFSPGQGDDVALQVLSVPEPGAASSALTGLTLLLGLQRFRRTASREPQAKFVHP